MNYNTVRVLLLGTRPTIQGRVRTVLASILIGHSTLNIKH